MAGYNKFNTFVDDKGKGVHDLVTDTLKIYLTNATPDAAADSIKADLAEIAAGNGYPAGGVDVQNTWTETGGTATLDGTNMTITASGGSVGPFRYAVLFNETPTTPADPLISYWDYGSSISLADGESLAINIPTNLFTES